jgi:hypothetical protein
MRRATGQALALQPRAAANAAACRDITRFYRLFRGNLAARKVGNIPNATAVHTFGDLRDFADAAPCLPLSPPAPVSP